jgi:hypothetical protein
MFADLGRKRKPTGDSPNRNLEDGPSFAILDSEDEDLGTPRKRRRGQASRLATTAVPIRRLEVIDLTDNTENCALCPNILGEGDDYTARIFVFGTCHCVSHKSQRNDPSNPLTIFISRSSAATVSSVASQRRNRYPGVQ